MKRKLYFAMLVHLSLFPPAVLCAGSPPSDCPGQTEIIFREDFQSCVIGQTNRPGYWTTSTEGPGKNIRWEVASMGALEPVMVLLARGDHPWRGEWRSEPIDLSSSGDAEISIEVYSDIYSKPDDNCYVHLFYQTDTGDPVVWFSQTGDIYPRQTFVRKSSPLIDGKSLTVIIRVSTELAMGEEYLFRDIRVTGTRPDPTPVPEE
ncbi:MAG: hypothetical protein P9M08_07255 [Candidatus Erginobacter occultus]|nr:hypothetical protein [Candidatus Erginobacter occultus]